MFVGELSRRKGFDLVLEAIPDLFSDFEELTIAGDGPLARHLETLVKRDSRIRWLGFVEGDPLFSAISKSSVALVPSRQDPWPLVAVEALTIGCPVVLGPGVGSAVDLQAIAGSAVVRMAAANARSLVSAARLARMQAVPIAARELFQPGLIAERFLEILRSPNRA
jgi:glycosyltransferase involved in cell wall biosynthesis